MAADYTRIDADHRYVVCAFYTPKYRSNVERLKDSLERLGLNYHLVACPSRVTWEATTRLKPDFVKECLERFPDHNILYVDADAVVHSEPEFFDTVTSDVALLFWPVVRRSKRLLSIAAGTLYIRNTPGGRKFVRVWREQERLTGPLTLDEDMIYMAFRHLEGVSFTALPRSYSKIFDESGPKPVIEHFQASRSAFKLSRVVRKGKRVALVAGGVAGLIAAYFMLFG